MPRSTVTTRRALAISWLATRTIPSAVSSASRPRVEPSCPTAAARCIAIESHPACQGRVGVEVSEQEVGVGDRRLVAAAAVAGGPGLAARRAAARRAGRRRGRASRSTRRPRRPCGRRPSGAGSTRPPISRESVRRTPPPSTTQTSHDVPPMSRPTAFPSPERPASRPAPTAPPAGPREDAPRSRERGLLGRGDPAGGLHDERRGKPARGRGRPEPAEVAAEQGGEVGVDHRRRAALVLAKLGQDLVRGRDVEVGQLGSAGARRWRARGPGPDRRTAGRRRPTRRRCRAPRAPAASSSSSQRLDDAVAAVRSRAARRSSGGTSGVGLGAQSRYR